MASLGTLLGTMGRCRGFLAAKSVMPCPSLRQVVRVFSTSLRGIGPCLFWGLVFVRRPWLARGGAGESFRSRPPGRCPSSYSEAIDYIDRQTGGRRWGATGRGGQVGHSTFDGTEYHRHYPAVPAGRHLASSLNFLEEATRDRHHSRIVGAGGIGMIIIERFRAQLYDQVAFVVLNVLVLIFAIDWLSKRVRVWAIGEKHDA